MNDKGLSLRSLFMVFWAGKWLILGITAAATLAGGLYAFLQSPVYQARALIAPREASNANPLAGTLAGLGGMGGIVASQFGSGNSTLDRLDITVKGWELAEHIVKSKSLLPRFFPGKWDSAKAAWKPDAQAPTTREGIDMLRSMVTSGPGKNYLKLEATAGDADMAVELINIYIEALNDKLRADVIQDSKSNQAFLQTQMANTYDPLIREKMLMMVAAEIEKEMLVGARPIDILEGPLRPTMRIKPQRKRILTISFILGLFAASSLVYLRTAQAAGGAEREA